MTWDMNSLNEESALWFYVFDNIESLNNYSVIKMEKEKELIMGNRFYKREEKYDVLIDNMVKNVMKENNIREEFLSKYPTSKEWNNNLVLDVDIDRWLSTNYEDLWNNMYNTKIKKNEKNKQPRRNN